MRRYRRQSERLTSVVTHQARGRGPAKVLGEQPDAGRGRTEGCPGKVSRFSTNGETKNIGLLSIRKREIAKSKISLQVHPAVVAEWLV